MTRGLAVWSVCRSAVDAKNSAESVGSSSASVPNQTLIVGASRQIVEHLARLKVTLIGSGGSTPGGSSWPCSRSNHQFFGSIGPYDFFGNADKIAQHAGPLGDRTPALRVDPPGKKIGDPGVGVLVAGSRLTRRWREQDSNPQSPR